MAKKFNITKPFQTRNGLSVTHVILDDKIMGVAHDSHEGQFCLWSVEGEKISLFPRKKNEIHDLDLVNVETDNNE